jgi:hypothetical protein
MAVFFIVCLSCVRSYGAPATASSSTKPSEAAFFALKEHHAVPEIPSHVISELDHSNGLPSYSNISVTKDLLCLFEISFCEADIIYPLSRDVPIATTDLFQTLFKVIISPNAP